MSTLPQTFEFILRFFRLSDSKSTMHDFISRPAIEIGRGLDLRGPSSYTWFVVTFGQSYSDSPEKFREEVEAATDLPFRVVDVENLLFAGILGLLSNPGNDGVILTGFRVFDAPTWSVWDINRSRLLRPGPVVLWLTSRELATFCNGAPNLKSLVGGSIFAITPSGEPLTAVDRSERIKELEKHYGLSSKAILGDAEGGKLPLQPHFVEWLVLLGRGDLV